MGPEAARRPAALRAGEQPAVERGGGGRAPAGAPARAAYVTRSRLTAHGPRRRARARAVAGRGRREAALCWRPNGTSTKRSGQLSQVEAHITGTVWKIEVEVGDTRGGRRHGRDPRVDEDGDARRGRGSRRRQGDPAARRDSRFPRATRSLSSSSLAARRHGGGRLLVDEPAPGVVRLTISNPDKRGALDHAILDGFTCDDAAARRSLRDHHRRGARRSPPATTSAICPTRSSPTRRRSSSRTRSPPRSTRSRRTRIRRWRR